MIIAFAGVSDFGLSGNYNDPYTGGAGLGLDSVGQYDTLSSGTLGTSYDGLATGGLGGLGSSGNGLPPAYSAGCTTPVAV